MTSSPDNTVERLLADFASEVLMLEDYPANKESDKEYLRLEKIYTKDLDSHYRKKHYKEFLELVGEDLPLPNTLGFLSEQEDVIENERVRANNKLRAELRTALQDRLGGKNG